MPRSTAEIVARLTLNAQQFSSEMSRAYASLERASQDSASRAKSAFEQSFNDIQRIAQSATAGAGGVQVDVAGARQAAAAAQQQAAVYAQIEEAARRAAVSTGDLSERTRIYLQAANAATAEARERAAALVAEANALELLQTELTQVATRTGQVVQAQGRGRVSAEQMRAASQQLSFQIGDVATQFASSTPVLQIFAQQSGQVVQAISLMTNTSKGFIGFLAGPWGAVLTGAGIIVATLAAKHGEAEKGAKGHKSAAQELTAAIDDLDKATRRITRSTQAQAMADLQAAISIRQKAVETRQATAAKLADAIALQKAAKIGSLSGEEGSDGIALALAFDTDPRVKALQGELRKAEEAVITTAQGVRAKAIPIFQQFVKEGIDPAAAATGKYTREVDKLNARLAAGQISGAEYRAEYDRLTRANEAQLEAIAKSEKATKGDGAAKREAAKAAREAAKEQREFDQALQGLETAFDPATAAARKYADTLQDISDLETRGLITSGRALEFRLRAASAASKEAEERRSAAYRELVGSDPTEDLKNIVDGIRQGQAAAVEDRVRLEEAAQQRLRDIQERDIQSLADTYEDLFSGRTGNIWRDFKAQGKRAIAEVLAGLTLQAISGQQLNLGSVLGTLGGQNGVFGANGGLFAQLVGTGLGRLTGGARAVTTAATGAKAASGLTGAATGAAGAAGLSGALGAVGTAVPYVAAAASLLSIVKEVPILGGLVGLLTFGGTPRGSATLGFSGGELGVASTRGNSRRRRQTASENANSVADTLREIAEQLGGDLSGPISTSIGVRNKSFRVDTTGQGRTKLRAGVLDFGQDAQAATEAAIRDALSDGVISGISQAARNILAKGGDLQKAIEQAVSIESIGKRIKSIENPLGAALDELNTEFAKLKKTLEEASATPQQLADAEKLYGLERKKLIEQYGETASQRLRDFLGDLRGGTGSPFSLRDQAAAAQAKLDPFLADIAAGRTVNQEAYQNAAERFLDIQRQLYGSTEQYFQQFAAIEQATNKAIEAIDKANPANDNNPFAKATAEASAATASNTQATAEILAQHTTLLQQLTEQLRFAGGGGGFLGDIRAF